MSGSRSRNKGARAERAVVAWLRQNGYPDARRYLAGDGLQPGDIDAIPAVCLEVKSQARYDLPGWLRQTITEAGPDRLPVLIVHPNGVADVGDWWAICRLSDFLPLLADEERSTP